MHTLAQLKLKKCSNTYIILLMKLKTVWFNTGTTVALRKYSCDHKLQCEDRLYFYR